MKHGSSTPRQTGAAGPTGRAPVRRTRRIGALAALGLAAATLATALSGCGIRDTALPVDAGAAASRSACPPPPNATLTKLASEATILPAAPEPAVQPSGKQGWAPFWPQDSARAWAEAEAKASADAASASPSAEPSATESDGTLSCLRVTTPAGTTTPSPSVSP